MLLKTLLIAISLTLQTPSLWSQSNECSNLNFEDGNLNNWAVAGNVEIVNKNQTDFYGDFPLALSGFYGVKLGNNQNTVLSSPFQSSVSRTITITNSNKYFIYGFSIVLLGYPHAIDEASFVKLEVTDANNDTIPCTEYTVHAQSSVGNGFYQSSKPNEVNLAGECCFPIYYKPWDVNAIDLSSYIGQTLTFNLVSDWCIYDVDWGYAYIDVYCSDDIMTENYHCDDDLIYLNTIEGLSSYLWSGPGILNGQGTNQVQINSPGTYSVDISNTNSACPSLTLTYDATYDLLPEPPNANFNTEFIACLGSPLTFQNTSISDTYFSDIQWSFGDSDSSSSFMPEHMYDNTGNYVVELFIENEQGCSDSIEYTISIVPPPYVELGPDIFLCDGEEITINPLSYDPDVSLNWSNGSIGESIEVDEPQEIILFATNGCTVSDTIMIYDHPAYFGFIPNVFTPNNDDINEYFQIENNEVDEYQLFILNRWGEVVFESNSPNEMWSGKANGKNVENGVYFYRINYRLSCQNRLHHKTGNVTVLR